MATLDTNSHLERLRARRRRMDSIDDALEAVRSLEGTLQEVRVFLNSMLAVERDARLQDVLAADRAGVPKTRISKELGWNRSTLYQALNAAAELNTREQ